MNDTEMRSAAIFGGALTNNVERVMVGKRDVTELLLVAILCEGHVLLEDVPGVGKTTLARSIARSINGRFSRIQFTPDLLPSDISGLTFFNQKLGDFVFRPGPIFTNVLLADEINRATPRTQSALLEAMEERTVTIDGETLPLPRPFIVLATENPVELEGTFPLPEAQLDRFLLRVSVGYPSADDEEMMLMRMQHGNPLTALGPVVTPEELVAVADQVRDIQIAPDLRTTITALVRATREHADIELGVSPRGTIALFRATQAIAAVRGRDAAMLDDMQTVMLPVLAHRIQRSPAARLRNRTTAQILNEIAESLCCTVEEG